MSEEKDLEKVKSLLEGPTHEWPWKHIEHNLYQANLLYNGIDYEIYAKLVVIDNQYVYEIVEINQQTNLSLN